MGLKYFFYEISMQKNLPKTRHDYKRYINIICETLYITYEYHAACPLNILSEHTDFEN